MLILPIGLKYKPLSVTSDFLKAEEELRDCIIRSLGIPPQMVGIEAANYASSKMVVTAKWLEVQEMMEMALWRQFLLCAMPPLKQMRRFYYLFPLGKKAYVSL